MAISMDVTAIAKTTAETATTKSDIRYSPHPFVAVQHDWEQIIQEYRNQRELHTIPAAATSSSLSSSSSSSSAATTALKFWLSSGLLASDISANGYARPYNDIMQCTAPFDVKLRTPRQLQVSCSTTHADTLIQAPHRSYDHIHPKKPIYALDVESPYIITGSADGALIVTNTSTNASTHRLLSGHIGDVSLVRLFPSKLVALTSAADLTLKLWSLDHEHDTYRSVLSMSGHRRTITGAAMIDRGKTFVTGSQDGTAKLWDCSRAQAVSTFGPADAVTATTPFAINGLDITDDYTLLYTVCDDGVIRTYDLRASEQAVGSITVRHSGTTEALTAVAISPSTSASPLLHAASKNGTITWFDRRQTHELLHAAITEDAAINRIVTDGTAGNIFTFNAVGSINKWTINKQQQATDENNNSRADEIATTLNGDSRLPTVVLTLSGFDCDPIFDVSIRRKTDETISDLFVSSLGTVKQYTLYSR